MDTLNEVMNQPTAIARLRAIAMLDEAKSVTVRTDDLVEVLRDSDQAQKAVEALNICIVQDDEREADLRKTIDALVAALEEIKNAASVYESIEGLNRIEELADAALALARGESGGE